MTDASQGHRFYPVGWDEIHRNGKALAWRLLDQGPWKGIVAITRGGLVPAAIVARELDIRIIETACAVSYCEDGVKDKQDECVTIVKPAANVGDGEGWLVIDDLVDTGRTFEVLRKQMPNAHYATIYAKPQGLAQVQTFITEVSQDTWIYFPWDIEAQFVKPIAALKRTDVT